MLNKYIVILLAVSCSVFGENKISQLINYKKSTSHFSEFSVLNINSMSSLNRLNEFVKKADIFQINNTELYRIYSESPSNLILKIKSEFFPMELELTQIHIVPDNQKIEVVSGSRSYYQETERILTYGGIIKGDNNSIASVTITGSSISGIISNDKGNFVLGPKKDETGKYTNDYIFYNDHDLIPNENFYCATDDFSEINKKGIELRNAFINNMNTSATRDSISVHFTADYQMYLDNGSNTTQVRTFITAVFNNVAVIYMNVEGGSIPVNLGPIITIYTTIDPYSNLSNSYDILNLFGANTKDGFTGDLAHLLSTGHGQVLGGIAWINVLCQPYYYFPPPDDAHYGRFAFSNIQNSYFPYPLYSWTVTVIAHEMGHNIASKHTHACVWPTNSGQIDSCVSVSGESCVATTRANNNGTIMSYCHLNGSINLARGFGSLPSDTLQYGYSVASCIDLPLNSSEWPSTFDLLQNYPNPFNPGTNIKFALPEDGYVSLRVYDITGKEVTTLVNNKFFPIGYFEAYFDASRFNLASGVYLYAVVVNRNNKKVFSEIKKMVLVK